MVRGANNYPTIPIWFVVAIRDANPALQMIGLSSIMKVIPADLTEIDSLWEREVMPLQQASSTFTAYSLIFRREPDEVRDMLLRSRQESEGIHQHLQKDYCVVSRVLLRDIASALEPITRAEVIHSARTTNVDLDQDEVEFAIDMYSTLVTILSQEDR